MAVWLWGVRRSRHGERSDRGGAEALGLVVLGPFVIGLALVVVWVGRSVNVDAQLRTAAEAGAQAGALERDHADAQRAARRVVRSMLDTTAECAAIDVEVPESARRRVGMRYGLIEVTVVCEVDGTVVPSRRSDRSVTAVGDGRPSSRAGAAP